MSKRQQSLARKQRSGQTEALHCFNSTLSAHSGWEVQENRAWLCACGLQRPACCQASSCENRIVVFVAESAAARAFAKSACLDFYFCFLPLVMASTQACTFAQLDLWPVVAASPCFMYFYINVPLLYSHDKSLHLFDMFI